MNINKLTTQVGLSVLQGYTNDISSKDVEKRLQEARKNGNADEIAFLENMLKIHKMKERESNESI